MGRRYIYNKKRRVRKVPNNVVLELENEKQLIPTIVHEVYETKKVQIHPRMVNLDSEFTLPSSLSKVRSDNQDHAGLCRKRPVYDNKLLVNLEHPMTLSIKRKSALKEHVDDKADKRLCKNKPCKLIDTEMKSEVLHKKIIKKIRIEPWKKNISQTMATNNLIKNNPTFILVSKTSIDDIEKNPINLIPNDNLRGISFRTLGTRISNSQMKNIIQHKPILLPKLASATSSNPIICVKAPDNKSQASGNVQHTSTLQKLRFTYTSNPIICKKQSDNKPSFNENISYQKHKIEDFIEDNSLNINELITNSNEDIKKVYPVALKVNNLEASGVLEVFSNNVDNENEMQILGI